MKWRRRVESGRGPAPKVNCSPQPGAMTTICVSERNLPLGTTWKLWSGPSQSENFLVKLAATGCTLIANLSGKTRRRLAEETSDVSIKEGDISLHKQKMAIQRAVPKERLDL